ncbi:unnamed protein product [marine sediment metagenome]|uniref:Uncharacterized protein n=1 Tax=marine sediment metagenome TaxID=412755 RepID=X1IKX1_9ZZZZ
MGGAKRKLKMKKPRFFPRFLGNLYLARLYAANEPTPTAITVDNNEAIILFER